VGAGGTLTVAGGEGTLLFWDRRTGAQLAAFEDTHAEAVTQVCTVMTALLLTLECSVGAPSSLSLGTPYGRCHSTLVDSPCSCIGLLCTEISGQCQFAAAVLQPRS